MIPKKLLDEINRWMTEGRYGHIQINFSGGKIVNYNITQSMKVELTIVKNTDTIGGVTASVSNLEQVI